MWLWICLILGIILGLACLIPETYEAPTNEVKVETIRGTISFDELLEEWDLQDHLEELDDEEN